MRFVLFCLLMLFCLHLPQTLSAQSPEEITKLVKKFKKDPRGPYKGIFWFCPDGSIVPPKERCEEPGGLQHALHKDIVEKIAREQGIYLGQILAGSDLDAFLNKSDYYSRLKQYQLEKFLQKIDDGWIMRRAQFYRGALQAEDEEAWGKQLLQQALGDDNLLESQYYLLRQSARDIPHIDDTDLLARIRATAKTIADTMAAFMDTRVKIHGQPDQGDLERVKEFRETFKDSIPVFLDSMFVALETDLELFYFTPADEKFSDYRAFFPVNTPVGFQLETALSVYEETPDDLAKQSEALAHLLWVIRKQLGKIENPETRLMMIDLSLQGEDLFFAAASSWQADQLNELLRKHHALAKAAAATGLLETHEWEQLERHLQAPVKADTLDFPDLQRIGEHSRRLVEWSAGMVKGVYGPVVEKFAEFEPLAVGFLDDRIRGSVLLPLGETAGRLANLITQFSNISNQMLTVSNPNSARGLNPGVAVGELVVIDQEHKGYNYLADKIYVLQRAPSDLKPVAGIATVSEGNAVSHVQLLARNLGIPNAVLTLENFQEIRSFHGQQVFYAVSPGGTIRMKLAEEMTAQEKDLIITQKRERRTITIATDEIDLNTREILDMSRLRAEDSGKLCGPKAANLGQLHYLFPGKVPPGLVIPFGIFYDHMQRTLPVGDKTYWEFLNEIFAQAKRDIANGQSQQSVEITVLQGLADLRAAIKEIPLKPDFVENLEVEFERVFKTDIGKLGMFIRSDTNMEDLKEFTGAGLNLTVPNIFEKEKILQAIRDVWSSPFTERSYKWRQRYLNNPENVYPSLLMLPTVDADKSGVLITAGIASGNPDDITAAFNHGVGGAVDGQAAETYLLRSDGVDELLAPAREPKFNKVSLQGGVKKRFVDFSEPLLSGNDRFLLRQLAAEVKAVLPGTTGIETDGPFDVELGFWNEAIWLFQVRPFVENRQARASDYLQSLDPLVDMDQRIPLALPLN